MEILLETRTGFHRDFLSQLIANDVKITLNNFLILLCMPLYFLYILPQIEFNTNYNYSNCLLERFNF